MGKKAPDGSACTLIAKMQLFLSVYVDATKDGRGNSEYAEHVGTLANKSIWKTQRRCVYLGCTEREQHKSITEP